jgi:threonine/homoserine/homoserine lactone efflux protein
LSSHAACTPWLTVYATVVPRAGDVLRRPPVRRALDRVTGTVLIGLGVRLALSRR